jgi:hypothetical protein
MIVIFAHRTISVAKIQNKIKLCAFFLKKVWVILNVFPSQGYLQWKTNKNRTNHLVSAD